MDDLEKRVQQFNSPSLPGQMPIMHMGTSYLVNDLWREVKRLREAAQQGVQADEAKCTPELHAIFAGSLNYCYMCGASLRR